MRGVGLVERRGEYLVRLSIKRESVSIGVLDMRRLTIHAQDGTPSLSTPRQRAYRMNDRAPPDSVMYSLFPGIRAAFISGISPTLQS